MNEGVDDLFIAVMKSKNLNWELSRNEDYIDATVFGDIKKVYLAKTRECILVIDGEGGSANVFRGKDEREVTTRALREYLK